MPLMNKALSNQKHCGFTLVETLVVMIVLGTMFAMSVSLLNLWRSSYKEHVVEVNLDTASYVINDFRNNVGRYPCPANPSLMPSDPNYGAEDCSLTAISGQRDTDGIGGNDPVLIGAMPIYGFDDPAGSTSAARRDLRLAIDHRAKSRRFDDPWNNEFVYAVSQNQTNTGTFDNADGVIRITDEWGRDTGGTTSNAQFIILSRGESDSSGCTVDSSASLPSQAEQENCDGDSHFTVALQHKTNTAHYDDYLTYIRSGVAGVWGAVPTGAVPDVYNHETEGKVFIGSTAFYSTLKPMDLRLDVDGDILAETRVAADLLCDDTTGANCIRPESIYELHCPNPGEYMRGVEIDTTTDKLVPNCQPIVFLTSAQNCPTGTFVNGIYTDGNNMICVSN